ncbi:hypothetical protein SDC9_149288 [bioreactor metagenome]|uniref:Uncharacterized protein n=1 Tax=bioreactor metagenome TaxID=1076179 RepID=A0A645EJ70_9ZZZZ
MNQAGGQSAVFAKVQPRPLQKAASVLTVKEHTNLVNENPCAPPFLAVRGDAVDDGVQHHGHSHGFQLLAQLQNIKAEDAV